MKKCLQQPTFFFSFFFFLLFCSTVTAQDAHRVGFQQYLSGTNFTYHSPYSYSDPSLLSRARREFAPIEWMTEKVPESLAGESISFIWLYGMDVLSDPQDFELSVNGNPLFRFSNPVMNRENSWSAESMMEGAELVFHPSMVDKHGDEMGYAVLSLPKTLLTAGQAVRLQVDGMDKGSNAWYMTFQIPLESQFSAEQLQTVRKQAGQLYHTVRFTIVHLAKASQATISVGSRQEEVNLTTGLNEIDFLLPMEEKGEQTVSLRVGADVQRRTIEMSTVKQWMVHLVQHTHTDIGYTRPQSEILAEHLRFIDHALDYCDQTDSHPEASQFRWTCEASWVVKEYLQSRPKAQIDRLLRRIKEGRIEVTGMYFNFAEIVDETALGIQTQALRYFKEFGIDVTTAMQNDVNGIGWCMVDLFHDTGLKYLSMGQHGHRARIPFDKPTSFWWESPSGKRLLAYRSEHYMHGNTLRLTSGKLDVFRNNLSKYLTDLDAKAYPLDRVALQFSGYITDNSPPSTRTCQIVKEWNDTYEWPKLKLSLASEFMMYLEDNHSDHLETKRVAWPDWWADGFGSATNETKLARTVHSNMIATMGLLSMAQASGSEISGRMREEINRCYEDLLFYDEHTFGADESISNPLSKNSIDQWRQKSAYVWSANQRANLLREKAIGIIMPHVKTYREPSVTVFNTLNWKRSGLAHVFIDHDIIPSDRAFRIVDDKGEVVPAQIASRRNDGTNWAIWVEDVPPLGYATYRIDVLAGIPARGVYSSPSSTSLENDHYKLVVDLERGGLHSLVDKQLGKELLDQQGEYPLGAFVLEQLDNRAALERLTYLNPDTVYRPLVKKMVQGREYKTVQVTENQIWSSLFLNGKIPECADERGLDVEIRLYHLTKKIELVFNMNKLSNTNPEGGYVAFPFAKGDGGRLVFEVQGGLVEAGENQLEGTASDWNTIQNFAAVWGGNSQVVFCSNDIPLVQLGSINTGRYYYKHRPETGHIYSWVFNNYWTTNFRADQRGELEWTYQLTSSGDPSNSFASKFGWENRIPLVTRFNVGQNEDSGPSSASMIDLNAPDNLLLVNARPSLDGKGIFLHLRETEGDHAILDVTRLLQSPQINSVAEVNSLEEEVKTLTAPLLIEHFETKFLLLKR